MLESARNRALLRQWLEWFKLQLQLMRLGEWLLLKTSNTYVAIGLGQEIFQRRFEYLTRSGGRVVQIMYRKHSEGGKFGRSISIQLLNSGLTQTN